MKKHLAGILAAAAALSCVSAAQALSLPASGADLLGRLGLLNAPGPREMPDVPDVTGGSVSFLVEPGLWESLPKLERPESSFVYARTGGLWGRPELLTRVRKVTLKAGTGLLAEAARNNQTGLDLFTDKAFRGNQVFYIPGDVAVALFRSFLIPGALVAEGVDANTGKPFKVQGIVLGAGHADVLYETPLRYRSPADMPGESATYRVAARVAQTIVGDGHVKVEGLSVMAPVVGAVEISEIEQISSGNPAKARVTTKGYGSRGVDVYPIRKR